MDVANIVKRMKGEILGDILNGDVPPSVASFSELHDHVDANTYGGFCDDDFPLDMSDVSQVEAINDCQHEVDEWLKQGRPVIIHIEVEAYGGFCRKYGADVRDPITGVPVVAKSIDEVKARFSEGTKFITTDRVADKFVAK